MSTTELQGKRAKVTGRKLAKRASRRVRQAYQLDPQQGVRKVLSGLAATSESEEVLSELSQSLREEWPPGKSSGTAQKASHLYWRYASWSSMGRPVSVQRIEAPLKGSYPLKRTHVITLNREKNRVIAEIRELTPLLGLRGIGFETAAAVEDLAAKLIGLIETKVRIPPHELSSKDSRIVEVLNYMIDWDQWHLENRAPAPLWGFVVACSGEKAVRVKWLIGPGGIRDVETVLYHWDFHPDLLEIPLGHWFHAVIRELPDEIIWLQPPRETPDPTDPALNKKLWDQMPQIFADQPNVWPLEKD